MHPDTLPTGKPVVGARRSYGEKPENERLGIGVLGLHEGKTMLVALRSSRLCRAVAACDLEEDKRQEAARAAPNVRIESDYAALLSNPEVDVVAIYTPDHLHAEHIEMAFRAGKHVICTKPLFNDLRLARPLLEMGNELGLRLQVGQSTRFYETFQRQRDWFEQGGIGEIEVLDAHYNHRMDWWYEKSPWTVANTHWAYLGLSHPIDLACWYIGEIAEVSAMGARTRLGDSYGMESPDAILVNMKSKDGRLARVMGNYGVREMPAARSMIECWLMGSEGASLARYPELEWTRTGPDGSEIVENLEHAYAGFHYRHELKGMHYGEFCNYADYFADCILSGKPNSPDMEEGVRTMAVMDAVVRSLETGKTCVPEAI